MSKIGLKMLKSALEEYKSKEEYTTWDFIKTKSGEYLLDIHLVTNKGYCYVNNTSRKVIINISKEDAEYLKSVVSKEPKDEK